ncbi:hypothetical protein EVJ50_05565 [Synechococcus sp. RSCCF101]|uniref:hypothetical protein n=1 Tax=Synechococcus sp. RSCCF101 TaxID=2511069 RepID=UPI001244AF54|nr:hypothetical protein [Synechococcus sp. RSCCF101]QEY31797.1 hypothetical protein EVJ50_05565 [Synechococcus sp. RSCCF101]
MGVRSAIFPGSYRIGRTIRDLSDRPVANGIADGRDIHLQEEVAEGGIRRWAPQFDPQRLGENSVMALT